MSKYATRLRLSLEDAEEEFLSTTGEETPEVEAVVSEELDTETVEATEEAAAEAGEAEAAVDEGAEKVEELEEAAAGLESIHDLLSSAIAKGKIHRDTVTFANIAIESYASRVGYGDELNMSTESFQPRLALEGIKEWVKAAWEALKKFLNKLWSDVKIFFQSLFNMDKKVLLRAERLARVTFEYSKPANDKINVGSLYNAVSMNGKPMDPAAGFNALKAVVAEAGVVIYNSCEKAGIFVEFVEAIGQGKMLGDKAITAEINKEYNVFKYLKSTDDKLIIGDVKLVTRQVQIPYVGRLTAFSTESVKTRKRVSDDTDNKISTYSQEEIRNIGKMAIALVKDIDDSKDGIFEFENTVKANLKAVLKDGVELKDETKATFNANVRAVRIISTTAAKVATKLNSHAARTALAYIQLAEKSAAQYRKEKKEDKK